MQPLDIEQQASYDGDNTAHLRAFEQGLCDYGARRSRWRTLLWRRCWVRAAALLSAACLALLSWSALVAGDAPTTPTAPTTVSRPPVVGDSGMVSSTNHLASDAGVAVLRKGGTALDAAVAALLAFTVVEPHHASLAGGGVLLYKGWGQEAVNIDFREEAPERFHPKVFCKGEACADDEDCDCADGAWEYAERCTGGNAVGVPGVPALLSLVARDRLATLPLADLFAPAVRYAKRGFKMYRELWESINATSQGVGRNPAASEVFLGGDGGPKVPIGETFKQGDLAKTLRKLSNDVTNFYTSRLAKQIVKAAKLAVNNVTQKGGLLSMEDMKGYRAVYRRPVAFEHVDRSGQRYLVEGAAPPFSGAIAIAEVFNFLELTRDGWEAAGGGGGDDGARGLGLLIDAQNAAFADRNAYVADADFVAVPVEELTSRSYMERRLAQLFNGSEARRLALKVPVRRGKLASSVEPRGASDSNDRGTSHATIIDAAGNVALLTTTLNGIMGSKVVVPGTGVVLNNQMCDFDSVGVDAAGRVRVNAPEGGKRARRTSVVSPLGGAPDDASSLGGKRPRSSMSPTIVTPQGGEKPFALLGLGAPGGSDIVGGVANVLRHVLRAAPAFRPQALQQAVDAPRAIGKNSPSHGSANAEQALMADAALAEALAGWDYNITTHASPPPYYVGETFSRVNAALLLSAPGGGEHGQFFGASDSLRLPACRSVAPPSS